MLSSAKFRDEITNHLNTKKTREKNLYIFCAFLTGFSVLLLIGSIASSITTPVVYNGHLKDVLAIEGALVGIDGVLLKLIHFCVTGILANPEKCKLYRIAKSLETKRVDQQVELQSLESNLNTDESDAISPIMLGVISADSKDEASIVSKASKIERSSFPELRTDTNYAIPRINSDVNNEINILRQYIEGKENGDLTFCDDIVEGVLNAIGAISNDRNFSKEDRLFKSLKAKLIFFLELKIFLIEKSEFLGLTETEDTESPVFHISKEAIEKSFLSDHYGILVGSTIDHICNLAMNEINKLDSVDSSNPSSFLCVDKVEFLRAIAL